MREFGYWLAGRIFYMKKMFYFFIFHFSEKNAEDIFQPVWEVEPGLPPPRKMLFALLFFSFFVFPLFV